MNTAAMTSGWPTREIALLIADPSPARSTGTDAIRTVVNGATTMEIPAPKTVPARSGPTIVEIGGMNDADRKSTRLNSSHVKISYAVFCLKKKKNNKDKE